MESIGKKVLFKFIVETLNHLKLKNQVYVNARKIRYILQRKLEHHVSPKLLSNFISSSLDWLTASGYLKLIKESSPKKYKIPDNFLISSENVKIFF